MLALTPQPLEFGVMTSNRMLALLVLGVKMSALANRTLNQKLNDKNKIMRVRNAWFIF